MNYLFHAVVTGFPQIGGSSQTDGIISYFFFIVTIELDYLVWDVTLLVTNQAILWRLLSNNLRGLYDTRIFGIFISISIEEWLSTVD